MKKINIIVFPYRSNHFKKKYGDAVRDIQIIELLKKHHSVENILVVERPLSVYEILLGRYSPSPGHLIDYSFDLLGPLKGRTWTENCYSNVIPKIRKITQHWDNLVVLDFTPIAKINHSTLGADFYWYDMIDNFTKHNRFSEPQKKLVSEKYCTTDKTANLITGVTDTALKQFKNPNTHTMPNGVFPHAHYQTEGAPPFKYGFFGFITDKFDVNFIKQLSEADPNARILLCGDILDKSIGHQLSSIKNITLHGRFSRRDTAQLASKFEIGIIPYRQEKSHDGSPLKLYEYMWFGKPTLTSIDYEYSADFIINYNKHSIQDLISILKSLQASPATAQRIKDSLDKSFYTEYRLNNVIDSILKRIDA